MPCVVHVTHSTGARLESFAKHLQTTKRLSTAHPGCTFDPSGLGRYWQTACSSMFAVLSMQFATLECAVLCCSAKESRTSMHAIKSRVVTPKQFQNYTNTAVQSLPHSTTNITPLVLLATENSRGLQIHSRWKYGE